MVENVKPIVETDSCEMDHLSYVISGRMRVFMDDGTEGEIGRGDVVSIPPGHDPEVIGDELVDLPRTRVTRDPASRARPPRAHHPGALPP